MSSRCTCCHVCHTSLKTSRRCFYPCSSCPTIICRPCIELTGQDWNDVNGSRDWSCPRCNGDCPCKRCKNKVSTSTGISSSRKSSHGDKPEKRRRRSHSPSVIEDNAFSPPYKYTRHSLNESPSSFAPDTKEDNMNEKERRIIELQSKNQQCLDYIRRTERLLALIRSEQDHITDELEAITKVVGGSQTTHERDVEVVQRKKFAKVAEKLYPTTSSGSDDSDENEDLDNSDTSDSEEYENDSILASLKHSNFPLSSLIHEADQEMNANMSTNNVNSLIAV